MARRHTGPERAHHRPVPARQQHPLTQRIWAHGFKFGDVELYIGPAKENPTVADAMRMPTILGMRERENEPYQAVARFTSVTAAKEFVQAMIRGLSAPGNAATTQDDGEDAVTVDHEEQAS